MRVVLVVLCIVFSVGQVKSQALPAGNWTKNDCSSNPHTLYNYLDAENVVAMIFGMGCTSCTDAASYFSNLRTVYNVSHPGRFKAFYMDYMDVAGNTCSNAVIPVLTSYPLDAGFDSCSNELLYYTTAEPMSYVVVAAGSSHTIIYSVKKNIFEYSDSVAIKTAIDNFLNAVGIKDQESGIDSFSNIYPNPSTGNANITVDLTEEVAVKIEVYNSFGSLVYRGAEQKLIGKNKLSIDCTNFNSGLYFVIVTAGNSKVTKRLVVNK